MVWGLVLGAISARAAGPTTTVHSGPAPVALIELFTSEGCSSCPPAEAWLGDLRQAAGLWRDFVPVAWHVNYWDHLGWRDPLADPGHTGRQRRYAAAWGSDTVYTPGFVRNGEEWRPRAAAAPAAGARRPAGGTLTATWSADGPRGGSCTVEFRPSAETAERRRLTAQVALLGGGIVSAVRRGENAGRTLRHEFVVLRLATGTLVSEENGPQRVTLVLPDRPEIATGRRALAVWVTTADGLTPVQAAGGWIGAAGPEAGDP